MKRCKTRTEQFLTLSVINLLLPLVALCGFQHHARVLAVRRAVGAARGFTSMSLPLHPAFAFPLARVVPAGDSIHIIGVGPPVVSG